MQYIDLTPRWVEILPTWLMMIEQAAMFTNPDLVKDNAKKELQRMAQAADNYGDLIEFLRKTVGHNWSDERLRKAIIAGRQLREQDRNTVKESDDA